MIAKRIIGGNVDFGPPQGWDEKVQGKCHHLWVRVVAEDGSHCCESAWEPTPRELEMLNNGGYVVLNIIGRQPPVRMYTEMPDQGELNV